MGDTSIAIATAERLIEQAINLLKTYGASIPLMTGNYGTKTWAGTDEQKGAVLSVAMEGYQYFKTSGSNAMSVNVSGLGYSTSTSTGGGLSRVNDMAKDLANKLVGRSFLKT